MSTAIDTTFGISLTAAKNLRQGQTLNATHYATNEPLTDSNGELSRFKVTSVKTWKRQPERVEIHLKRGLREFHVIDESDLSRVRIA